MSEQWRIYLLGELRAVQGDREVTRFRTHKTAVLWATLACKPSKMHSREQLLTQLWPDASPGDARNNLSVALSSLRNQFEPPAEAAGSVIRADRNQVGLNPGAVTTDMDVFERALEEADRFPEDVRRVDTLENALAGYGGPLLPGYYEDWLSEERRRLAERHMTAIRLLVRMLVKTQELPRALEWARRAAAADPLREDAQRDLMQLTVATGQPSIALKQFREFEVRLKQELNAVPSAPTRRMAAEIEARLKDSGVSPTVTPTHSDVEPDATQAPGLVPTVTAAQSRAASESARAPGGTVTFVVAQLAEGRNAETEDDASLAEQLRAQSDLLGPIWNQYSGYVCERTRDTWEVAFANSRSALQAAIAGQRALGARAAAGAAVPAMVRMAIHTADVTPQDGRYYSRALQRGVKLLQAGHGGQILCSEVTAGLLRSDLDAESSLVDLGVYRLIGLSTPERVFQVTVQGQPASSFGPLRAEFATASHLPLPMSRFFGRESEHARLISLLQQPQTRLVTLTGPGGTGKTRLALEAARRLVEPFGGAVWFVSLGDVAREDLLTGAVADALGIARNAAQDPLTQVIAVLSVRSCLLVLDNLEHLLAPTADWLADLLARAPTVTGLATSRERLNLDGEIELAVPPLPVPPKVKGESARQRDDGKGVASNAALHPSSLLSFPSVALFVDRCQAVLPDFNLTAENAPSVATLCNGLEGLPLAIELAAARAQVATPAQMVAMLGRRFDLLVSRRRDLAARHRTMRATIEWSYNLLAPELQRFFRMLAVFRGGLTLEAAEEVCDEPLALDYLAQLREGSLIVADERSGEMRYSMLETLREYAQEQLGNGDDRSWICSRHLDWFLAIAEQSAPDLLGARQRQRLEQLELEHDNLRAACESSCVEPESTEPALRLVGALWLFWYIRGHVPEGRRRCAAALELADVDAFPKAKANALNGAGNLAGGQGDQLQARSLHEESLAMRRRLGDLASVAGSLNNLGNVAVRLKDHAGARAYFEQALDINRMTGNRAWEASNLHNLGEIARTDALTDQAAAHFKAAMAINQETGNQAWKATNLNGLGEVMQQVGDLVAARACFETALSINRDLGDRVSEAYSLFYLGSVAEQQGCLSDARGFHEQALSIHADIGDRHWMQRNREALDRIATRSTNEP